MRIRVVNPNTTAAVTETIARAPREAASAGTGIEAVTSTTGPISIEGYYDEAMSLPGLLKEIRRGETEGADAHVIACFDDTGLDAARPAAGQCPGCRHRRGVLSCGDADRIPVYGGDDLVALHPRVGAQPPQVRV
jgi:Asp/Glu/hydantoin racemase